MFELSVAFKYLRPRWRQLSVSIITLISMLVIALVVWLIVVFFSVTTGLEKSWIHKLTALTAPVRITPTEAYYHSYYYLIDTLSAQSNYTSKSIREKLAAENSDPYNPSIDEEIPADWPKADREADGSLRDPVKKAFSLIQGLKHVQGLSSHDFEVTISNLRLRLVRGAPATSSLTQSFMTQTAYIGSLDPHNTALPKSTLPLSIQDINNVLRMMALSSPHIQEDTPSEVDPANHDVVREKLLRFFSVVDVKELKAPLLWSFSRRFLFPQKTWDALILFAKGSPSKVVLPLSADQLSSLKKEYQGMGIPIEMGTLKTEGSNRFLTWSGQETPLKYAGPILLPPDTLIPAQVSLSSIDHALAPSDVRFEIHLPIQNTLLEGNIPLGNLEIAQAHVDLNQLSPFWLALKEDNRKMMHLVLPEDSKNGEAVMLPKTFREAGVLVGDRGFLSYQSPTASSIQEQRIPIFIAGFYDPGIIPIGGKCIIAGANLTSIIRASSQQDETPLSNGINVRFEDLHQADHVKKSLETAFRDAGIASYWKIETFREYEFTKDLLQQLKSDRNLFTLIATVIIIVACSNIISMLIILVNDKKMEIGILRSMGASAFSIAAIFGICGVVMGFLGSLAGTIAAVFTLKHLDVLIGFLSKLQGYEAFNPVYYGETLPNEMSLEALAFVIIATALVSLAAGLVPALKASWLRPSAILRSD